MTWDLTDGQKTAIDMMFGLMESADAPQAAVLTGFAGTGKTTMISAIASLVLPNGAPPLVLAPTGKAALRVQEATGLEASTIHRWLYSPREDETTGVIDYRVKEHDQLERPDSGLVIVDEASMLGRDIWEDLWDVCSRLELNILLIGDPFQLPPVEKLANGEEPFQVLERLNTKWRTHLDEVTRQALDSPILRASMLIRKGDSSNAFRLLDRVYTKDLDAKVVEVHQEGGSVVVHRNATRHRLNTNAREGLGRGPVLEDGEPLLVLRNNYALDVYNGEVVEAETVERTGPGPMVVRDRFLKTEMPVAFDEVRIRGKTTLLCPQEIEGATLGKLGDAALARGSRAYYERYFEEDESDSSEKYRGPPYLSANYGYALTCHKSQGSEWKTGLVLIERSVKLPTVMGRRWAYTAVTRFKEKCYFAMEA